MATLGAEGVAAREIWTTRDWDGDKERGRENDNIQENKQAVPQLLSEWQGTIHHTKSALSGIPLVPLTKPEERWPAAADHSRHNKNPADLRRSRDTLSSQAAIIVA